MAVIGTVARFALAGVAGSAGTKIQTLVFPYLDLRVSCIALGYASVRVGVWSDGRDSRERLDVVKQAFRREIDYSTSSQTRLPKVSTV